MITEGEAAILLETTRRAFRNQSQSKQRSTLAVFSSQLCNFKYLLEILNRTLKGPIKSVELIFLHDMDGMEKSQLKLIFVLIVTDYRRRAESSPAE